MGKRKKQMAEDRKQFNKRRASQLTTSHVEQRPQSRFQASLDFLWKTMRRKDTKKDK